MPVLYKENVFTIHALCSAGPQFCLYSLLDQNLISPSANPSGGPQRWHYHDANYGGPWPSASSWCSDSSFSVAQHAQDFLLDIKLDIPGCPDGDDMSVCAPCASRLINYYFVPKLLRPVSLNFMIDRRTNDFEWDEYLPEYRRRLTNEDILREFSCMQEMRCPSVTVKIDGQRYEPDWATVMMSRAPIIRLHAMIGRLQTYVDEIHHEMTDVQLREIQRCAQEWDVKGFENLRSQVLVDIAKAQMIHRGLVFQDDRPVPTPEQP